MKTLSEKSWLILVLIMSFLAVTGYRADAATYKLPIDYLQTDTPVVRESQVLGWPAGHEDYDRTFQDVAVSGDGSKIAFWVQVYAFGAWHLFVANVDGSGLTDVTSHLPANWQSAMGLLDINHNGSKIYGGGGEVNWFCDIAAPTPSCSRAVFSGIWDGDGRKSFTINKNGSQLFFRHVDATGDKGLFGAVLGGVPSKIFDLENLHCDSLCGDLGLIRFLGVSRESGRLFFTYDRDWRNRVLPVASTAMYYVSNTGGAIKIAGEEHDYVWSQQNINNDLASADGSRALYYYMDSNKPQFHWVDVASGTKTLIAGVEPNANTTISADGKLVLFTSGTRYRATRVDLETMEERDTGSYFIVDSYGNWTHSGLTEDKRYYFYGAVGPSDSYLRKVDMKPTSFSEAPNISAINFSAPALIHADDVTETITVQVSDAQGLENIDWVNLSVLVEGREEPSWPMGRAPIIFPPGDGGSTRLYDDGTHGDAVAGDGIFTFEGVATRKGDYDGFNTWYTHFTLPHAVGLRVIVKDKNDHYTIADTTLTIRETGASNDELIVNFGTAYGLYQYDQAGGWKQWNAVSPSQMVTVDLNGDGSDELVAAFPGYGLYKKDSAKDWQKINDVEPGNMIAADIDGDGKDELVAGFNGYGLYYYDDPGGWKPAPVNTVIPDAMVRYSEGMVCDFGAAYGLWSYNTSVGWVPLNAEDPDRILAADIDGDGKDELVVSFVGWGLYIYEPGSGTWQQPPINTVMPHQIIAVDIDGDDNDELVASFPGYGLYTYEPEGRIWEPINAEIPEAMIRLGNGIAADYRGTYGLWVWSQGGGWQPRNTADPGQMVAGDIDKDGIEELVVAFSGYGLYYHNETNGWQFLNGVIPKDIRLINFYP